MDPSEYATMFDVEDRHWWYAGMRRITGAVLDRYLSNAATGDSGAGGSPAAAPARQILDAGCGTGANLAFLSRYGVSSGVDIAPLALELCRRRDLLRLAQCSVSSLPFACESFDLITSFEVLYHLAVEDDAVALAEAWRVLKPGGWLLLRLPAHDWLRGQHDQVVHTRHRYTTGEVRRKVTSAGFSVVRLSYANCLLFPLALGKRLAERLDCGGRASDIGPPPPYNAMLAAILGAEAGWLARWPLPWGLSVLCLARKGRQYHAGTTGY
jgi:SAM-dependent methyltransferase